MSAVRDARQLQAVAAIHKQAVAEGLAAGYFDDLNQGRADALVSKAAATLTAPVTRTNTGEVVPQRQNIVQPDSIRTIAVPGMVAIEASEQRTSLLDKVGALPMGLELAEELGAADGQQKMLSHGMAALHMTAMQLLADSAKQRDPVERARLCNGAARLIRAFQDSAMVLHKLKHGDQRVTVTHVHVEQGAQAIVGNVTAGSQGGGTGQNGVIP